MASPVADASRRRREKRRQLDARRSKCRIRLGGHMEQWCLLKERLGFSLHSQLAKFLLDRYTSSGCVLCAGPEPLPQKGLQYLVLLSHRHSRECSLVPGLRGPGGGDGELVWECSAGHTFSWEPSLIPTPSEVPKQHPLTHTTERTWCSEARREQEPEGLECEQHERTQETRLSRGVESPLETFPPPGEEQDVEEDEDEDEELLSDASPWTYSSSPDDSEPDIPKPPPSPVTHTPKEGEVPPAPATFPTPCAVLASLGSTAALTADAEVQPELSRTPQTSAELQMTESLDSPGSQAQSAPNPTWDEDTAQIGLRRIRKAAKRELMPCDFPGCGRIFSNRQYLNHHKKYQHIHQKSFCCPEPACGKSFNFKKHLKEHVKLHSDTRDYICEFCARSFRTSSNLVIHRRIHTGEKPLQCEICGFTCRQKASLNWHRRKHAETAAALRFPCEFCGKRFEKPDSVAAHCSKSHPTLLPAHESPGSLESSPSVSATEPLQSPEGAGLFSSSDSNLAPSTASSSQPGELDPRDAERSQMVVSRN
ncbi:zinc finger protein 692 isoform X1 [Peromyscus californicus insignis]|uniref:zinc finger protein 692 isoform X1 n=1 Tax=Peromyscus californicus insignis TaxID=564181 RepID=UPI0022A7A283|nr:zinc finger protein 692 isoform X1 [Peromyscus californicus insignis]XP_052613486.1 zinc finger protein 692 isoform X1 [Peromyscus californicus insignis]